MAEKQDVDFVSGQVHALRCFAMAMATAFAQHPTLRAEFEKSALVGLGILESSPIGNIAIEGFQEMIGALGRALQGRKEIG